jgi:hypothetical protein
VGSDLYVYAHTRMDWCAVHQSLRDEMRRSFMPVALGFFHSNAEIR